jgi:glucose/arabinose dehydrogenase
LSGEALIHVKIRGDQASKADQWDMGKRIRAVDQGPDGAVYLLEDEQNARLLRLTLRR